MIARILGTLSARIIAGFVVVIITVATIAGLSVLRLDRLDREVGIIRGAYLQLALRSLDLAERQASLLDYLKTDLPLEVSKERIRNRIRQFRSSRDRVLEDMERILETAAAPDSHIATLKLTEVELKEIRTLAQRTESDYEVLESSPPTDVSIALRPAAQKARSKSAKALASVSRIESAINVITRKLENTQRHLVVRTAAGLQEGSRYLRALSIIFGAFAVGLGILVAVLVALALRPLQRLRIGAQNIAKGDYQSRIDERGPSDIAELAREFNLMRTAIEERERELVRSERLAAVGKIAATIAHEVRNPLSSIGLNTELLEDELGGLSEAQAEEARGLCKAITGEVDRLTEITGSYLSMAKVPQTTKKLGAVNQVITQVVEFEKTQLANRGVTLKTNLDESLGQTNFDENQLRQVLLNLIRNGADAVEENGGGLVTVATSAAKNGIRITVVDNGPGIPEKGQAKLFDAFYSTKSGGTGLGLAVTHQVIRAHGGDVKLISKEGQGATFEIFLPGNPG